MRASHTSALSGSPRQAAPVPVEASSPSMVIDISTSTGLDLVQGRGAGAEDVRAGRGVVGDGVAEADVPVLDAAAADLERGDGVVDRPRAPAPRRAAPSARSSPEHEGDLGLDPRLQHDDRDRVAVGVGHVVEEHAEVGLVDPELLLHRRRGQADLAADHSGPVGAARVRRCCTA